MKSVNQALTNVVGDGRLDKRFIEKRVCKGCNKVTEVYEMKIFGGPDKGKMMEVAYGCICEDIKLAEKTKATHRKMQKRKMMDAFEERSLINRDLMEATFEGYEPRDKAQAYAKRTAERYVEIFDPSENRNLCFMGGVGVGKSHLAKCIADGVMEKGHSAIFITIPTLLRKIRSTYNRESQFTEDDFLSFLEDVDLLILDDVGVENDTKWTKEKLFDLINARQGRCTVYTTNYDSEDLQTILGKRIYSRMAYNTEDILIRSDNFRLKDKG